MPATSPARALARTWTALTLLLSGCGADRDALPVDRLERDLPIAFSLPSRVAADAQRSRALVLEAVFRATQLAGVEPTDALVRTGTLDVARGTYAAEPSDRLVLLQGGEQHELRIERLSGNDQAPGAAAWQMLPHVLRYTHAVAGKHDLVIAVDFDGASFEVRLRGWTTAAGRRVDLELTAVGTSPSQLEFQGRQVRSEVTLLGTLTAPDLEVEVEEKHVTELMASGAGPPGRKNPTRTDSTCSSTLRSGGSSYHFDRVRVREEPPLDLGAGTARSRRTTLVDGRFLRDAAALGRCVLVDGRPVLRIDDAVLRLDLADG